MRPERGWRLRRQDILEAIERLDAYATGLTRDQSMTDARRIDAVMYRVGVIGGAIANLPEDV